MLPLGNKATENSTIVDGDGNIIGISAEDYRVGLKREREETEAKMEGKFGAEREKYQKKISELNAKLADIQSAYEAEITRANDIIEKLQAEHNQFSHDDLDEAMKAAARFDYEKADALFAQIIDRNEMAIQETARAEDGRGEIALAQFRYEDAISHQKRAVELAPTALRLNDLRHTYWQAGQYQNALDLGEDCEKAFIEEFGKDSAEHASHLNNQALILRELVQYDKAEELLRQALEIDKKTIGEEHPEYAKHLNNLAIVLQDQGQYEEAEELLRQALEIDKKTIGEEHPQYATHLSNLATNLGYQKRFEEAIPTAERALEIRENTLPEDHPEIQKTRKSLANMKSAFAKTQ